MYEAGFSMEAKVFEIFKLLPYSRLYFFGPLQINEHLKRLYWPKTVHMYFKHVLIIVYVQNRSRREFSRLIKNQKAHVACVFHRNISILYKRILCEHIMQSSFWTCV